MTKLQAFLGGLMFGGVAGATLGLLSAPKPGSELRQELAETYNDIYRKALYELQEITDRVDELKSRIEAKQAMHQALEDFTPRVDAAVGKAQSALGETVRTTAESQQMLQQKHS